MADPRHEQTQDRTVSLIFAPSPSIVCTNAEKLTGAVHYQQETASKASDPDD